MSFDKKGRKIWPKSGKSIRRPADTIEALDGNSVAAAIAQTLHASFGGTGASIKTVMAYTGAGERAVKNWFQGKNAPNGKNLIELVRHSDEVLETVLLLADRQDILAGKLLVDAREQLVDMLTTLESLIAENADQSAADGDG